MQSYRPGALPSTDTKCRGTQSITGSWRFVPRLGERSDSPARYSFAGIGRIVEFDAEHEHHKPRAPRDLGGASTMDRQFRLRP
jgi:hypothetical protein